MEKQSADRLIIEYKERIFGYALNKMRNISQAEELASDIICEVYNSFLQADEIINTDGYVYRISCNVYSKYIHRLTTGRNFEDISEILVPYNDNTQEKLESEITLQSLKNEIGYLSQRQRTIIYLHYYEKKSVAEISKKLGISKGTVKWHLSDARNNLMEEMVMERNSDNLSVNPIRFETMGHNGYTGDKGDTSDMFDTKLKQNIAYACYFEECTAEEIARKINVPVSYVVDELKKLVEFGYIDAMDNSKNPKYRTNMYITDERGYDKDREVELYREAAKKYCDEIFVELFKKFDEAEDNWGFFCDGNDKNFMKYNITMMFIEKSREYDWEIHQKYAVKRPDGGCFIAHAYVEDDCSVVKKLDEYPYWSCGYMTTILGEPPIYKVSLDCRFSDRSELRWRDDLRTDWEWLYKFIESDCDRNAIEPEQYKRLCDKGYIFEDRVQVMGYLSENAFSQELMHKELKELISSRITVSEEMREYEENFIKRIYDHDKDIYPDHIKPICRLYSEGCLSSGSFVPYIIEEMLERGMLKPLSDLQKKNVLTYIAYKK